MNRYGTAWGLLVGFAVILVVIVFALLCLSVMISWRPPVPLGGIIWVLNTV